MDLGPTKEFTSQIFGASAAITTRGTGVQVQTRWMFTQTQESTQDASRRYCFLVRESEEGLSGLIGVNMEIAGHMVGNSTTPGPP
mmetsp:Transcript_84398/g.154487  ORF Transcript_84398/g.154487 Transcript_84398/m.154487 type:complete len:85 (+) Transcript_84398:134-388(+)